MTSSNHDQLLREIVFFIHEHVKKNDFFDKKENILFKNHFFNTQKLKLNWPLKKGSVEKNILSWNVYDSSSEVVNAFLAFTIKCLAMELKQNNLNFSDCITSLDKIFMNDYISGFFWDDIKKYYQAYSPAFSCHKENRIEAMKNIIPHSSCIALCIDSSFFRLRSGTNQELSSFEYFIEDLYNANNSLIVFSRQKLIHHKKNELKINNYSISFKMNKDIIKTSIHEALEPQAHLIQSNQYIEPNKTGCFDRLISLLTSGQSYVQNIEKKFAGGVNTLSIKHQS